MKLRVEVALAVFLVGCSQQDGVKDAVKAMLTDPSSAQFQRVLVSEKGDSACAIWNAKNAFGGYVAWSASALTKSQSGWEVVAAKIPPSDCTEQRLNARDRFEKAQGELDKEIDSACSNPSLPADIKARLCGK